MNAINDLHDAELYALRHDVTAQSVQCLFRTVEGQDVALELSGVIKFRCSDFGLQNVVLELSSTAWQKIGLEDLRSQIAWLCSTADGERLVSVDELKVIQEDVVSGRLQCVFLVPSWGAQLAAISSKVELRRASVRFP